MKKLFSVYAATLALVGCSSVQNTPIPEPEAKVVSNPSRVSHMVFFGWDSAELPPNIADILSPHVMYLLNHPDQKLLIEGAADETGDEQYNYELGMSRANQVKRAFQAKGIASHQLIVRSIGINRPLNHQNNAQAFSRNRRAMLVY